MLDPNVARGAACWALNSLGKKLDPKVKIVDKRSPLTDEESRLLNQLREGGPCVICGGKGDHMVWTRIWKYVGEEQSGALFWKTDTKFFDIRSVVAPLCSKHYQEAKDREKLNEKLGCATMIFSVFGAALISYLMLQLKRQGHCIIPVDDVLTVILWFVIALVACFIFTCFVMGCFSSDLGGVEQCVWQRGPLKRLCKLNWFKSER